LPLGCLQGGSAKGSPARVRGVWGASGWGATETRGNDESPPPSPLSGSTFSPPVLSLCSNSPSASSPCARLHGSNGPLSPVPPVQPCPDEDCVPPPASLTSDPATQDPTQSGGEQMEKVDAMKRSGDGQVPATIAYLVLCTVFSRSPARDAGPHQRWQALSRSNVA